MHAASRMSPRVGDAADGVTGSALYHGRVVHHRHQPREHRFEYRVFSLLVDLDELDALDGRLRWFGHNRFSLFSLLDRDHGSGDGSDLRSYVRARLGEAGIDDADGPVRLLCYPRVLGYVFNPLSVYYCERRDGSVAAVIYEVNNAHDERHSYVIPVPRSNRKRAIRQACDKDFYVSPFMPMDCRYRFHIEPPVTEDGSRLTLFIHQTHREQRILDAWFVGMRQSLTDAALLRAAFAVPLLTLRVTAGILWQALKLWRKGLPIQPHKPKPAHGYSYLSSEPKAGTKL